ncbi:MAG: hypothetical protein N2441_03745 [Rhodocyclaceae bacterium]|nr:hypothetical protein [Rhodocyclaceae bacterium]
MKRRHWPLAFLLCAFLGTACLLAALLAWEGTLGKWHPMLADPLAGWGFLVSAIACFLTGAFPLVLRRLAEREGA